MHPKLLLLLAVLMLPPAFAKSPHQAAVNQVDPFIGVDGGGAVFPGAVLPFGLVSLSPDTVAPQETSGYRSNKPVIGFSHKHSSGTGGTARYGNLLVAPQMGTLDLDQLKTGIAITKEAASPGFYSANFVGSNIQAELTASARSGVHRYRFPQAGSARILLDISSTRNTNGASKPPSSVNTATEGRIVSDRRFEGHASFRGGWGGANPHTVYFVAEFDRPFTRAGGWQQGVVKSDVKAVQGLQSGLYAEFDLSAPGTVGMQVGVSYLSVENARRNLGVTQAKSFEQVRADAVRAWSDYLGRIEVVGGSQHERTMFYSALYRTVLMPADVSGDVPGYPAPTPQFWNFYCIWDTYHTVNPLYTLIVPDRQVAILNALLAIEERRGWLPDAWIANDYGAMQGGTHADTLFADAFVKNLRGFNRERAYAAIRKNASEPAPAMPPQDASWGNIKKGRFGDYFKLGYLPIENALGGNQISNPTSRTLEYSVNDFSVATVARILGKSDDADHFTRQALSGWTLWNPATKFFWAKDRDGKWVEGFTPTMDLNSYQGPYYEGTPWQYTFAMRHDVQGLINRLGGDDAFLQRMDAYFDGGFHTQSNQPTLLTPWLHVYAGRPDKTVDRVRHAMSQSYKPARTGLPGNDDAGTMSAWYVFAAMGFYPVTGQDVYLLGSPIFSKVRMQLGDSGKTFVLSAPGVSSENRYIQSATLNGKPWNQAWFRHADISAGAELVLKMGPAPSKWGRNNAPPSLSARTGAR
ncbi:MAG: GH92 family glycosyl hydrolase [Pseudomonadota bacterium]